jgi:geranylgeranyl diphosphate synthase type I
VVAPAEPEIASPVLQDARAEVDPVLLGLLADRRAELAALDPAAAVLVDELVRLVRAGGKRIRPALCAWAFRAAGGTQVEPIWRACAGLELLHTSALVHDDVMDGADERRGVASTHRWFAEAAPAGADAEAFGTAAAILVGDLALVLSEQALRTSGFAEDVLARALTRFDRMRLEMAAGQFLDVAGSGDPERVTALKSGSYTATGPVLVGAALAGAGPAVEGPLGVYARLMGEAFQLRDDVLDGDAPPDAAADVGTLLHRAVGALEGAPLAGDGALALSELADLLRLREADR